MKHYRIVKEKHLYEIQRLHKRWIWFGKEYWELCGDGDHFAIYRDLEDAKRQLSAWEGKDFHEGNVILEKKF